jgi:hypothetical protein
MNTLELDGLDGRNPLHVLAAFGAFALTDKVAPGATLAWTRTGASYAPRIATGLTRDAWTAALLGRIHAMGSVKASEDSEPHQERVNDLDAALKSKKEALKSLKSTLKAEAKALGLKNQAAKDHGQERVTMVESELAGLTKELAQARSALPTESNPLQQQLTAVGAALKKKKEALKNLKATLKAEAKELGLTKQAAKDHGQERIKTVEGELAGLTEERRQAEMNLAMSLGFGPAHLGEVIGVAAEIFRLHAQHALVHDPAAARQLAALATDACVNADGAIEPTPYSFSNGSSGKKLLKDFRALARACTREDLDASLFDGAPRGVKMTALNWDPRDLRSYAHQWSDPAKGNGETDVAANALAYAGLSLLPCFPGRRGIEAVGFVHAKDGTRGFVWPLWSPALVMPAVRALLASASAPRFAADLEEARARGVFTVLRARVVNPTGKRNFLAPSSPKAW